MSSMNSILDLRLTAAKRIGKDPSIDHTVPLKVVYSTVEYKDIRKSEPKYKAIEPYEKSSFRKPGNMSEKSAERKLDDKDIALLRTIL